MVRYWVNVLCGRLFGADFPYGIMLINISGSTVMGLIAGYLAFRVKRRSLGVFSS